MVTNILIIFVGVMAFLFLLCFASVLPLCAIARIKGDLFNADKHPERVEADRRGERDFISKLMEEDDDVH